MYVSKDNSLDSSRGSGQDRFYKINSSRELSTVLSLKLMLMEVVVKSFRQSGITTYRRPIRFIAMITHQNPENCALNQVLEPQPEQNLI